MINFWYTKNIFASDIIDAIIGDVTGQPIQDQSPKFVSNNAQQLHYSPPPPPPPPQLYQQQPQMQQQRQSQMLQQQQRQPQMLQQQQQIQQQPYHTAPLLGPPSMPVVEKPYYEMPAGLMLLTKVCIINLIKSK